mmetsp:Transcript_40455/g.114559  ORF Transcript_40455/g.114559 Transcript_40455/m.114559 type:complete len:458 (+) Transcript_40455:142-1515(+)
MADRKEFQGGELVVTGGTAWGFIGRTVPKGKKNDPKEVERAAAYPNLDTPHRVKSLLGVKIMFVAAGSAACHSICGDAEGRCYTWGRNEKGQLGHGDLTIRNMPTPVEGLEGKVVVSASAGKNHSIVVTDDGKCFSFGSNQYGQLGIGECKSSPKVEELHKLPLETRAPPCKKVACGAEFTMFLCGGELYACGLPQYGQLGNGSDLQYNTSDSSIKMVFKPQPVPEKVLGPLADKTVVNMACGHNHTICTDSEGTVYSWGFGGYGRLGHHVQKDEMLPRKIDTLSGRVKGGEDPVMACGSVTSFTTTNIPGMLYSWGRMKANGDNTMYPKSFDDLCGWNIRAMACGNLTYAVASETSTITWGQALNCELGFGPKGRKSAACPDKCMALEGFTNHCVACGVGHMCHIITGDQKAIDKLPVWENKIVEAEPDAGKGKGGKGTKRKAEPAKGKGKAKGKK